MQSVNRYYLVVAVALLIIFGLGLIPLIWPAAQTDALYYGWLFFVVLLGASVMLLLFAAPRSTTDREQRDYRVVHFTLRLALAFGIGAVVVAVLLVAALLGFIPSLRALG